MLHDLEIAQLRRFVALVDTGSFAAAANTLCITQQALSSSIAKMEDSLGVRLFDRSRGRKFSLTAFGRLLLPRARSLIAVSEQTLTELSLLRDARGGSVTVGIGETMAERAVATAIRRFHHDNPDVQVRLMESYTQEMIDRLIKGEVDFVVGGPYYHAAHDNLLDYRYLFSVNDILLVRPQHPLAGRRDLTLHDLREYTWVLPHARDNVQEAVNLAYLQAGITPPQRIIRSDAIITGTWLMLDNDYIISATPAMTASFVEMGMLVGLDNRDTTLTRYACVITQRNVRLGEAAKRLMDEIIVETERLVDASGTDQALGPVRVPTTSQTQSKEVS